MAKEMEPPPAGETRNIALNGIAVPTQRWRQLRDDVVAELAASMKERGLLQPIIVRPHEVIGFHLVAGRHRLEAARRLKWESIRCEIKERMDANEAALAEIEENLIRADLTPTERALHHAERKKIQERRHPATKHGGGPGKAGGGKKKSESGQVGHSRYTKEAAKKLGISERQVRREVHRAEKIPDIARVIGTSLDNGEELDALAKLPEEEQAQLIDRAAAGENVSAKAKPPKSKLAGGAGEEVSAEPAIEPVAEDVDPVDAAAAELIKLVRDRLGTDLARFLELVKVLKRADTLILYEALDDLEEPTETATDKPATTEHAQPQPVVPSSVTALNAAAVDEIPDVLKRKKRQQQQPGQPAAE